MVTYNIRRQNTCYNIVFVCVCTRWLFCIIYSLQRGGEMFRVRRSPYGEMSDVRDNYVNRIRQRAELTGDELSCRDRAMTE